MRHILLMLAATVAPAVAQHFPLDPGNTWLYRSNGPGSVQTRLVEVTASEDIDGNRYSVLRGLFGGGDTRVRQDAEGRLLIYQPETRQEVLWAPLGAPERSAFKTGADECTPSGTIASRKFVYDGPAGHFETAVSVTYDPGQCADAGIVQDVFLPYVGLLRREETSIAGPRVWELVYAAVGGSLYVNASGVEFSLATDRRTYSPADTLLVRFALRNKTGRPVVLEFPSGQEFDIAVFDARGTQVYRWSIDKLFIQAFHTVVVNAEKNWAVAVPLAGLLSGRDLPPGRYTAEAFLTTNAQEREYSARVLFTIE